MTVTHERGHPNPVICNFLQPVITTFPT